MIGDEALNDEIRRLVDLGWTLTSQTESTAGMSRDGLVIFLKLQNDGPVKISGTGKDLAIDGTPAKKTRPSLHIEPPAHGGEVHVVKLKGRFNAWQTGFIVVCIVVAGIVTCNVLNRPPTPPDVVLKTMNIQCAREDGTEEHRVVGEVKYASGELEKIYVKARIKFYTPTSEGLVYETSTSIERDVLDGDRKKRHFNGNTEVALLYKGDSAFFETGVDLAYAKNIRYLRERMIGPWGCEVEYSVISGEESTPYVLTDSKEYKIKPEPNRRHDVVVLR